MVFNVDTGSLSLSVKVPEHYLKSEVKAFKNFFNMFLMSFMCHKTYFKQKSGSSAMVEDFCTKNLRKARPDS